MRPVKKKKRCTQISLHLVLSRASTTGRLMGQSLLKIHGNLARNTCHVLIERARWAGQVRQPTRVWWAGRAELGRPTDAGWAWRAGRARSRISKSV